MVALSSVMRRFAFLILLAVGLRVAGGAEPEKPTNRLAKETSPYLLQHAHNPVDWYPWGEEALAKAKADGKLIFLSIGYSACHWCHVMEHESFEDAEIAKLLNEHFVCIKVDREERPDIDAIYMTALQVYHQLAGSGRGGGWPLSMFLTPDADPFVGGTYFPARDGDRPGAPGFFGLLGKIQDVWIKEPQRIREDAQTLVKFTKAEMEKRRPSPAIKLDSSIATETLASLAEEFDPKYGGFGYTPDGRRPKFPVPSNLVFLLDRVRRTSDDKARTMLVETLEKMSLGGIRDHLGGGFHRYTVDRYWHIPHFEKMLYDNGQLVSVYAQAWELTKRDDFKQVAVELCEFVLRELADGTGGFYAALDADSEGEEGKFYRWDKADVESALAPDDFKLFAAVYGLDRAPNFEEKYYVPRLSRPLAEIAAELKIGEKVLNERLAPLCARLLEIRNKRPRPRTDTKILAADNGLMIGGLADVGRIFNEPRYVAAAERAAAFVLEKMRGADQRLLRTYAGDTAKLNAYLNDYAFLTDGLLRLYEATKNQLWLDAADSLTKLQVEHFADEASGGFFFTSSDHEKLLARGKELVDGAQPAGNSVSAHNLLALAKLKMRPEYVPLAEKTILATLSLTQSNPSAAPRIVAAAVKLLDERQP
jgi:uncharacterized protein YyaL (SSP411 family)